MNINFLGKFCLAEKFWRPARYLRNTPQNDPSSGGGIIIHIEAQSSGSLNISVTQIPAI